MNISIVTVFPQLYEPFLSTSLVKRAQEKKVVSIDIDAFFSFVQPKERIDAPTFGHGVGMLIRPEVVERAVDVQEQKHGTAYKIFFSPQGKKLDQKLLAQIAQQVMQRGHLMLLPARYEGMDARVEQEYADEIISVGDFVLMGGDLPAMMLLEGLLRLWPGVVGKQESVQEDSFTGPFVDYPAYTAPVVWKGHEVPPVVRSGDHNALQTWRTAQAARTSVLQHFHWVRSRAMTAQERMTAAEYIPPHYVALMHCDVLVGSARDPGVTSVTSLDIHDIARSARTYGLKNLFLVTPLADQQKIVHKLLSFWNGPEGIGYNRNRHNAVKRVCVADSLTQVIADITQKEGKPPLLVATSAQLHAHDKTITFYDQQQVWQHDRPVLFLLGTGKGLTQDLVARCDYMLLPVHGFSDYNHLSVRSAAAIIFDRWLGICERMVDKRLA